MKWVFTTGLDLGAVCIMYMMTSSNGNIFRVTGHLCGEFTGPGEFPAQRPVTRSFDIFFDLRLNKRMSKQSWGWWFETLSCPLWRHCNDIHAHIENHQIGTHIHEYRIGTHTSSTHTHVRHWYIQTHTRLILPQTPVTDNNRREISFYWKNFAAQNASLLVRLFIHSFILPVIHLLNPDLL